MKKVLIIAGEASGDLHGSLLMKQMKILETGIEFRGIGGPLMKDEGLDALRTIQEMNIMGFIEVLRHLPFLKKTMRDMEKLLDEWKPDLVILIDYPGFNLRFARTAKSHGTKVMYYISPQIWAWHKSRVEIVRKYVDRMVVIFEFEKEFYLKHGIETDFVGHPLLEVVKPTSGRDSFRKTLGIGPGTPIIGLVPGSRPQEIKRMLAPMAKAVEILGAKYKFACLVACAQGLDDQLYLNYIKKSRIILVKDMTYDVMAHSDVLAVTSGTATIEAGILGTPMVIVYRTSALTYSIGKILVNIDHIGMINIVAGERVAPELLQGDVNPEKIAGCLEKMLGDKEEINNIRKGLASARLKLGSEGASGRAALIAANML